MVSKPPDALLTLTGIVSLFGAGAWIALPEERWIGWLLMVVAALMLGGYAVSWSRWRWALTHPPSPSDSPSALVASQIGWLLFELGQYHRGLREVEPGRTYIQGVVQNWPELQASWTAETNKWLGEASILVDKWFPTYSPTLHSDIGIPQTGWPGPEWRARRLRAMEVAIYRLERLQEMVAKGEMQPLEVPNQ